MINVDLLWWLMVPLFLTAITIFVLHKLVDGMTWLQSTGASAIGWGISAIIISAFFYIGKGAKTHDTEILNGQITSKDRVHGSYIRTYSCNCYTTCSGSGNSRSCSETCQTCYEDHYTVTWTAHSTLRNFTIDGYDWTSSSVYLLPDPARYTIIKPGDPASVEEDYTNYIKAVPETLFRPASATLKERFKNSIPAYPIRIYDFYKIDRVIPVGVNIPDLPVWNEELSRVLRQVGPAKQANVVIVIAKTNDPSYFYALQDAWLNGKKNDIVVVIGAMNFPAKADWVRVMALTQDELFQVKLRDDLLALDKLDYQFVINAIADETVKTFKRKRMRDFQYLDAEIDPPFWCMMTCMFLVFGAYCAFWIFAFRNPEIGSYGRYGNPRFSSY